MISTTLNDAMIWARRLGFLSLLFNERGAKVRGGSLVEQDENSWSCGRFDEDGLVGTALIPISFAVARRTANRTRTKLLTWLLCIANGH